LQREQGRSYPAIPELCGQIDLMVVERPHEPALIGRRKHLDTVAASREALGELALAQARAATGDAGDEDQLHGMAICKVAMVFFCARNAV
jgi:hypothetical protein